MWLMVAVNSQLTTPRQTNLPFTEPFLDLHDIIRIWCHNSWHHNHTHWGKGPIASSTLQWSIVLFPVQMLDQGNSVSKCILKWWVTLNLSATLFRFSYIQHYSNQTLKALRNFASELLTKSKCSRHLNSAAKISNSCSHAIFLARESWNPEQLQHSTWGILARFKFHGNYRNSCYFHPKITLEIILEGVKNFLGLAHFTPLYSSRAPTSIKFFVVMRHWVCVE